MSMPKPLFKPPRHLVKEWPEVFEDLYMNTMPIEYLDSMRLEFLDGRVWEINFEEESLKEDIGNVAELISGTIQDYKTEIQKIDFKINIEKLKFDIQHSTNIIF